MFLVPDDHDAVAFVDGGDADATTLDQTHHALRKLLL